MYKGFSSLVKLNKRMRDMWKGGLVMQFQKQTSIPSSSSHKEADDDSSTSDDSSDSANEALNNIMNLSVFG